MAWQVKTLTTKAADLSSVPRTYTIGANSQKLFNVLHTHAVAHRCTHTNTHTHAYIYIHRER